MIEHFDYFDAYFKHIMWELINHGVDSIYTREHGDARKDIYLTKGVASSITLRDAYSIVVKRLECGGYNTSATGSLNSLFNYVRNKSSLVVKGTSTNIIFSNECPNISWNTSTVEIPVPRYLMHNGKDIREPLEKLAGNYQKGLIGFLSVCTESDLTDILKVSNGS